MLDTSHIFSLTDFLRNHTAHVSRITSKREPELLTVNGKAAVVVQDHETWQQLVRDAERTRTADAIREGIAAAERGELIHAAQALSEIRRGAGMPERTTAGRSR